LSEWIENNPCLFIPLLCILIFFGIIALHAFSEWLNDRHSSHRFREKRPSGWKGKAYDYKKRMQNQAWEEELRHKRETQEQRESEHHAKEQKLLVRRIQLALHSATFRCGYCDEPSTEPKQKGVGFVVESFGGESGIVTGDSASYEDDWSEPGDLHKCPHCHRWFCNKHFYNGYCINYWKLKTE
jgi:hypothetical protein